jgi:hypothetical protein
MLVEAGPVRCAVTDVVGWHRGLVGDDFVRCAVTDVVG